MKKLIYFGILCWLALGGVACSDGDSKETLTLTSAKNTILPDGQDYTTFTVKYGEQDVTAQAKIYANTTQQLSEPRYSSTVTGSVKFQAIYDGQISNEVILQVQAGDVDNRKFLKKAVFMIFTSASCTVCPQMGIAAKDVAEAYPDRVAILSFHDDFHPEIVEDIYKLPYTPAMRNWSEASSGFPAGKVDADFTYNYVDRPSRFQYSFEYEAIAGVALETSIQGEQLRVKVKAKIVESLEKYQEAGICLWLTESKLDYKQLDGNNLLEHYEHNYVVRGSLTPVSGGRFGYLLSGDELKAGTEIIKDYTFDITGYNADNLEVVGYVYTKDSNVDNWIRNCQKVKAGNNADYQYEE